eukprot:TRINITY_DN3667_c0_g1_i4.p1 TRINITY_DN3667_c0_g1~~TRINITY_DN3667_c0_g1_i4.p1  ORF type:complete len:155 (-),score=63.44 TRINITY_DN3667_c0_g1_i4:236-700(-)
MKVLVLTVLSLCLLSSEGRKIGKRNGKNAQTTRRVWHMAEAEEGCGNYTELMSEEKPSELCVEANTTFCICTARENISEDSSLTEDTEWQFKCGTCDLKWSVEKDETEEESKEGEKKVKKEKKKLTKIREEEEGRQNKNEEETEGEKDKEWKEG